MADENWQQIRRIFDDALRHRADERRLFVRKECRGDKTLLREVESLLSSHDSAESFMETPAVAKVADVIETETKKLERGTSFAHYEIIEQIGEGGMGEVYLARDKKLDRGVAVKVLNEKFSRDESNLRRFISEAKAASALNHPNILTIYEFGESEDVHYIICEFIDGKTLREHLRQSSLNLSEILDISIQIAGALSAAHESYLVHRDIKPDNIMIRPDGYVKILDFGLAKLFEQKNKSILGLEGAANGHQTAQGVILGTVNYMSPEQAKGERVDGRTDIFSLGAVLYEMIAGRTPFEGDSILETLANLINAEPPPLAHFTANLPDKLEKIIAKMLRKSASERYLSMKELLADLKELRENLVFGEKLERRGGIPAATNRKTDEQNESENDSIQTQISKPVNAYQAYQLARYHFQQLSPPELIKSRALLNEALRFDADFALAYAALAEQSVMDGITGLEFPVEAFPKAREALRRVAELDSTSTEFYAAAGLVDLICNWNLAKAERNLRKSLELNSHYAFANNYLGQVFMFRRQTEEAEIYLQRAVAAEPMSLYNRIMLTIVYFFARVYQRVIEECDKMLAVYPRFVIAGWMRCWALEQTGRAAEAIVEYEKILREPDGELVWRWIGYAYAIVGNREKALATAARVEAERREHFVSPTHLAALFAALNEIDKAIFYLEKGVAERDPWILWIDGDPRFDNLQSDSRFDELVRRVGLK